MKCYSLSYARYEVFTVVKIEYEVFCVVAPHIVAVGYLHFGGPCYFHHTITLRGTTTQKATNSKAAVVKRV